MAESEVPKATVPEGHPAAGACPWCKGEGKITWLDEGEVKEKPCPKCKGKGIGGYPVK